MYGDCHGEWVTEERPPRPDADRARRRLDAEQALLGWGEQQGVAVVILRVPGIYGPGRLPERRVRAASRCCARRSRRGATACTSTTWCAPAWPPQARPAGRGLQYQ